MGRSASDASLMWCRLCVSTVVLGVCFCRRACSLLQVQLAGIAQLVHRGRVVRVQHLGVNGVGVLRQAASALAPAQEELAHAQLARLQLQVCARDILSAPTDVGHIKKAFTPGED